MDEREREREREKTMKKDKKTEKVKKGTLVIARPRVTN